MAFDITSYILGKKSGGGGSSITVEALSVTENRTYTAPTGKAYSPVTVNVSGGSSDFTTATVTISTTAEETIYAVPFIQEAAPPFVPNACCRAGNYIYQDDGELEFTVVLYKGEARLNIFNGSTVQSVTGSITKNNSASCTITGDGTITFA